MRDVASIEQLTVMSNLENLSSVFIAKGMSKNERFLLLKEAAQNQLNSLRGKDITKSVELQKARIKVPAPKRPLSTFNKSLKRAINNPEDDNK